MWDIEELSADIYHLTTRIYVGHNFNVCALCKENALSISTVYGRIVRNAIVYIEFIFLFIQIWPRNVFRCFTPPPIMVLINQNHQPALWTINGIYFMQNSLYCSKFLLHYLFSDCWKTEQVGKIYSVMPIIRRAIQHLVTIYTTKMKR